MLYGAPSAARAAIPHAGSISHTNAFAFTGGVTDSHGDTDSQADAHTQADTHTDAYSTIGICWPAAMLGDSLCEWGAGLPSPSV
jgi:hypothetical protein